MEHRTPPPWASTAYGPTYKDLLGKLCIDIELAKTSLSGYLLLVELQPRLLFSMARNVISRIVDLVGTEDPSSAYITC